MIPVCHEVSIEDDVTCESRLSSQFAMTEASIVHHSASTSMYVHSDGSVEESQATAAHRDDT